MTRPIQLAGLEALAPFLAERGVRRALVITGESRRFVDRLAEHLDSDLPLEVFDGARVHVPRAVVDAAEAALGEADAIVTLGGGAATGLGKALRRVRPSLTFVAIPTTYAGSEQTAVYGVREGEGDKTVGRDEAVRPDAVIHAPELFLTMPKRLTITSLLNALAHPISALSTLAPSDHARDDAGEDPEGEPDALDAPAARAALEAVRRLAWALDQVAEAPSSVRARAAALDAATLAGRVIDGGALGAHHHHAHALGGRFDLPHAELHAALLPHTARALATERPAVYRRIAEAAGHPDLPATLYDLLVRAGAPRSLLELGLPADAEIDPALADARVGRRPSIRARRNARGASVLGPTLADARRAVIVLHGRGADAGCMLAEAERLVGYDPTIALVAPQAPDRRWYPRPYGDPLEDHAGDLDGAIAAARAELDEAVAALGRSRVFLLGFSQGACLAAELLARAKAPIGGVVAIAGARIGPADARPAVASDLTGARVLLGIAEQDRWVRAADVRRTAEELRAAGAEVELAMEPGDVHAISDRQRLLAQELLRGVSLRDGPRGFGGVHEAEALAGALPRRLNTPRHAPYGLYPEQINATGFTAPRAHNRRAWLYRVRPSAQHTPFEPLAHPTLRADWDDAPPEVNLTGHAPLALPTTPTDFVDGLATYGGAGDPALRRGFAMHLYVANRSMDRRCFYDADGDLLLVPQSGRLLVRTELGALEVGPRQIALVPRGLRFSVLLRDGAARGYVAEVYGRSFELPERGPLGANGLTDPRHFRAPSPWFEDRVVPGYRVTAKMGNAVYEATQDHSPYDVAAWHGQHVPFVYDLGDFSPAGHTRFDHPDPSVYTVLGAALDEAGASSVDFVFFPPRWDVSEGTFRPPYFHRNATSELNGIVADPSLDPAGPFAPGCVFLTPSMTAHGVLARAVEAALKKTDAAADRPHRTPDGSAWFQLESALPVRLTRWARERRDPQWPHVFGSYRAHFDPTPGG